MESAEISDGHPCPRKTKQEKSLFTGKTTFPLAAWIDARREPRNSPRVALHFHHRHSSPKPHTCRAHTAFGPHDKLLLGLLSKISTRQREWPGRGERKRGAAWRGRGGWGSPNKALPEHRLRQKRRTNFSCCWQAKRIHFNHKSLPLWSGGREGS